jgi:hypothetical protein
VGLKSLELAAFLSTQMVNGCIVNAMIASVAQCACSTTPLQASISVEDLTFSSIQHLDDERWNQYEHHRCFKCAQNLGDRLRDGSLHQLVVSLNIGDIHWAVLFLDGPGQWIKYEDSLGWAWPKLDSERIQRWLHLHGFPTFYKAGSLPHGIQVDSYSCTVTLFSILCSTIPCLLITINTSFASRST